ncbi:MAG: PilZ domain-containing protein [Desulfobacteraceae bacterium]|nr:PilZ domain-containing protein [Desulfobacteraceae bacterium]
MREPLFTNTQHITQELAALLKSKISLNFYQQNNSVQPVLVRGIDLKHEPPLVVLLKKNGFRAEEGGCCLLYRTEAQIPRGFNGTIIKQSEHHLGIPLPEEIFQIQRRKCGRYSTPPPSKVVFTLKDAQRLHNGRVVDISCEGAKLAGLFPPKLEKDLVIGPLSFSLHRQFAKNEITHFNAAEAVIAWTARDGDKILEMGLRLHLAPAERDKLEQYIEMRSLEEAALPPTRNGAAKG